MVGWIADCGELGRNIKGKNECYGYQATNSKMLARQKY
jgi:hypothetical protein